MSMTLTTTIHVLKVNCQRVVVLVTINGRCGFLVFGTIVVYEKRDLSFITVTGKGTCFFNSKSVGLLCMGKWQCIVS
jgi:hypothetical protein